MTNLAKKNAQFQNTFTKALGKSTRHKVENTFTEEIIIAICSPIGSFRKPVIDSFSNKLHNDYNYTIRNYKLSDFILKYFKPIQTSEPGHTKSYTELYSKILGGDELRKKYKNNSILAELAILEIYKERMEFFRNGSGLPSFTDITSRRICYIIDSLKNKEELDLLRSIYKDLIYVIGIFSPLEERIKNLRNKGLSEPEAKELIETDDYENNQHGQNVRNTFIESDFFFRVSKDNLNEISNKVERYLHLIFGSAIITPRITEKAMYNAKAASVNSGCLSRQVGAAIIDSSGDVISRGWNDVPKFGGNLYSEDDAKDLRCKDSGICSNDQKKDEIVIDVLNALVSTGTRKLKNLSDKDKDIFMNVIRNKTKVNDLIEFSKSVHAEMHAIIIGSQNTGSKMIDGKLFCTTYPCHNCARHIILAGIKEVYYIEPYIKSLSVQLHKDAITEDENVLDKVRILPYDGVAPRRYLEFFNADGTRKVSGKKRKVDLTRIFPKSPLTLQALPVLEAQAIHSLKKLLRDNK